MATLNGTQRRELVAALVDAFPTYADLEQMVSFGLDEGLQGIAGPGNAQTVAFSLVRWAEARGRLGDLVEAARAANPGNLPLRTFATGTWVSVSPAAATPSAAPVRSEHPPDAVVPEVRGESPGRDETPQAATGSASLPRFFVSYNRADRPWAEWIAWQLEAAGHGTVLQAWDFRPGDNFVGRMQRATAEADRTIAVLSPDYLASDFTAPEWQAAFRLDPRGEKGLLVPVRVRDCDPTGLLGSIVYLDLVGLDEAAARATLLAGIVLGRAKPGAPPAFPAAPGAGAAVPAFPGAATAGGGAGDERVDRR